VITGNNNSKTFLFIFRIILYLPAFICIFFFYSGEGFFILYKESKEKRKVRNVRLVDNTDDSSILLISLIS